MAKDKDNKAVEPEAPSILAKDDLPEDPRLLAMQAQIDELKAMLKAGAVNALEVKVADESQKRFEEVSALLAKGNAAITQEIADARYPGGKFRWKCVLEDGNRHPEVVIGADNDVDAAARYRDVCGILSAEKAVKVVNALAA